MELVASDTRVVFVGTLTYPRNLCCIEASIDPLEKRHSTAKSVFHSRILKCRQLIFNIPQIIATPKFETESKMYIVMDREFYESGEIRSMLEKLKILGSDPVSVPHDIFVSCLRYTVATKIAPLWNQVKEFLVCGRSFLTSTEPLPAVKVDICTKDEKTFMVVWPTRIILEQTKLQDLGISQKMNQDFSVHSLSTIPDNCIEAQNVHVLPNFAKGQIMQITHHIPETCPYKTYKELKRHWKNMYGYRLPEEEGESTYYTISFINSTLRHVIPSLCIRAHEVVEMNPVNSHILEWFHDVLIRKTPLICGHNIFSAKRLAYAILKEEESCSAIYLSLSQPSNEKFTDLIERDAEVISANPEICLEEDKNTDENVKKEEVSDLNTQLEEKPESEIAQVMKISTCNGNMTGSDSKVIEDIPQTTEQKSIASSENSKTCLVFPRKPLQDIPHVLSLKNIEKWPSAINRTDMDAKPQPMSMRKGIYSENCESDNRFIQSTLSRLALSAQKIEAVVSSSGSQGMQGFYTFPAQNLLMEQTRLHKNVTFQDMLSSGNQQVNIISSNGQGILPDKEINLKRDASMLGQSDILGMVKKKPRSRPQVQLDVDVELVARNNDLQRVNKITLVYWLRNKLVPCKVKDKKSDLVVKVMEYLNLPIDKVQ